MTGQQKNFLHGNNGVASYGAVVLIMLAFVFFTSGMWVTGRICERIKTWDDYRVETMKQNARLDTIRYALIWHRMTKNEYPDKLSRGVLQNLLQDIFYH